MTETTTTRISNASHFHEYQSLEETALETVVLLSPGWMRESRNSSKQLHQHTFPEPSKSFDRLKLQLLFKDTIECTPMHSNVENALLQISQDLTSSRCTKTFILVALFIVLVIIFCLLTITTQKFFQSCPDCIAPFSLFLSLVSFLSWVSFLSFFCVCAVFFACLSFLSLPVFASSWEAPSRHLSP